MKTIDPLPRTPKPFLKWAGGKGSLLGHLTEFVPRKYSRYCEAFVGGGAFFFHLAPPEAILSDANAELINCFSVVQQEPKELIASLMSYKNEESEFYRIRAQNPNCMGPISRAARFIYLNKTCFNGLYRVNKAGSFNTPYGRNIKARYLDEETLITASAALKGVKLICGDFAEVLDSNATKNDFVYFDPPYMPVSEYSDFKRYTPNQFREEDHIRLAQTFRKLSQKGCHVLLSNSYHPTIKELYKGFDQLVIMAPRFINCRGGNRGHVKELLIRNF